VTAHFNRSAPRPEICGPSSGEIDRDRYTRAARNRTRRELAEGWQGLETADWENYYSLAGSSRRLYPLRHRSDEGFEPGVMLIAPLPPAGNMYSRSARNVRTKTTRKRHTSAPPRPPCHESRTSGRPLWTKIARRWLLPPLCHLHGNSFHDYFPSNLRHASRVSP